MHERVTIEAVNDGKNYVFDEDAVKEIGWIWTTEVWEDGGMKTVTISTEDVSDNASFYCEVSI